MRSTDFLQLIRYQHYIKNFFIFLPLFFSSQITNIILLQKTGIVFIVFCIFASVIYIINDIADINYDKQHPIKNTRPLASGTTDIKSAVMLIVALLGIGITLLYFLPQMVVLILLIYVGLNIAYSYSLKHIAIIDVSVVAVGFVLRLFAGAVVGGIILSNWIVIMTFLLALFLALAKRRDDVLLLNSGTRTRKVIDGYSLNFIDNAMMLMASVVIVAYLLYTTSTHSITQFNSQYLYLSVIFVILGIMRYMQLTIVKKKSGSPTKIALTDRFMQIIIAGWVLFFIWTLYL